MIKFDAENHLYFNEQGFIVPSVTEIISAVYGTGLENAPAELVARAAAKGTAIHKELEQFIKTGKKSFVKAPETANFVEYAQKHSLNLKEAVTEKILHAKTPHGEVCGTADLIIAEDLNDYKTSKTATNAQIRKWQMQLSFYKYMAEQMGHPIKTLKVLHLTESGCDEITLEYLGDAFVLETMRMYAAGEKADQTAPQTQLQTVPQNELDYVEYALKQIDAFEKQLEPLRAKIKAEMEQRGILSVTIGDVNISYVAAHKSKKFDSTKFKAEHAKMFALYQKESEVKSAIRITVK